MKKTVVIGATPNPNRYAYLAIQDLLRAGYEVVPVGIKKGHVKGMDILDLRQHPEVSDVNTVTLYIGARHQPEWYDYLLGLKPKRIIFNPGTENQELVKLAEERGIETVYGCTLVMLSVGTY